MKLQTLEQINVRGLKTKAVRTFIHVHNMQNVQVETTSSQNFPRVPNWWQWEVRCSSTICQNMRTFSKLDVATSLLLEWGGEEALQD